MKANFLLPSALSAIGLVTSLPVAFVILILMWLFVYGDGVWPEAYGMDMISFVLCVSAIFFSLAGFCLGLYLSKVMSRG